MVLGNSMLVPILPQLRTTLDVNLFQVGLLITMFSLPAAITIPFAGFLSDRLNRKAIMVPALVIYGLGGLFAGFASILAHPAYPWIMAGRVIQGLGAGGTYQLAMALTGDVYQTKERARALGLLEASNGLGKVVAPLAGAALALIVWYLPFFTYGFLALPIALAVWLVVEEPSKAKAKNETIREYFSNLKEIFQQKGSSLLASTLAGMVVLFILFGVLSYLSDLLERRFAITGLQTGFTLALPVGLMALTSYLAGNYLGQRDGNKLKLQVLVGLTSVAAGLLGIGFSSGPYALLAWASVLGLGTGLVLPGVNLLITGAASAAQRGIVTCFYGSLRFLGVALGPAVFGLAAGLRPDVLFTGAAVLVAGVSGLCLGLIQAQKMLPPELLQGSS